MKFKVIYGVTPNMFGRLGGHMTLIGDDGSTPYDVNWFLDLVIDLCKIDLKDVARVNDNKKYYFASFYKLEKGVTTQIVDSNDRTVAVIQRVDDTTTLEDLIAEEYGCWFIIYWLFATLTIAPINIFFKGIKAFIKNNYIVFIFALICYLVIVVGIPLLIKYFI